MVSCHPYILKMGMIPNFSHGLDSTVGIHKWVICACAIISRVLTYVLHIRTSGDAPSCNRNMERSIFDFSPDKRDLSWTC